MCACVCLFTHHLLNQVGDSLVVTDQEKCFRMHMKRGTLFVMISSSALYASMSETLFCVSSQSEKCEDVKSNEHHFGCAYLHSMHFIQCSILEHPQDIVFTIPDTFSSCEVCSRTEAAPWYFVVIQILNFSNEMTMRTAIRSYTDVHGSSNPKM